MIELRPYQQESISLLRDAFKNKHRRIVLCLPTGAGKTVVFSEMVRLAAEKGTQVFVLTDRVALFEQTFGALKRVEIHPQLIAAGKKIFSKDAPVSVGMVETVNRREFADYNPALIIIDEAHKGSFNKIIDRWPNAKVIGATATPIGKHFFKYYTDIIANIDTPELIEHGFLAPCKAYQMQDDFSDLKVSGNDYSEESLFQHFNKAKLYAGCIEEYTKRTPGQKAICYCVNVQDTVNTFESFRAVGLPVYVVHSKMKDSERNYMKRQFEADEHGVMVNCGILTTGYDHSPISVGMVKRATMSLALWLQMCGRPARIYRTKPHFTILDFGGNHTRHGLWDEPRTWTIEPPKKKKLKEQPAPVKKCPQCEAIIAARAMKCQFCGHEFPESKEELKLGVMVEVKPKLPGQLQGRKVGDLSVDELIELQKSKTYKASYVWRVIRTNGEESIKEFAAKMGYKDGWVQNQINDLDNVGFKNYVLK